MIFHVLFLHLETGKRRKLNKVPALSINSFSLEVWCGFLVMEDQGAAIYGFSLKKTFVISTVQKRYGKNDISCVISCFRVY